MKDRYLEVTFRHGRPIAAYYYLPRGTDQKSVRTRRVEPGLIIDFAANGQAIGIEITAPNLTSDARRLGHSEGADVASSSGHRLQARSGKMG